MDEEATRGERKSIAGNETIAVGDAARDGMWPLRMGSVGGGSDDDRTGADILAAAEGVRVVRGGELSISRSILPTERGRGNFLRGVADEKRAREKGGQSKDQI